MPRATSASVYGSRPLDDTYHTVTPRRAYGLRSESAPDGYYAGPVNPRKPRPRRNGPVRSNMPDAATRRELAQAAAAAALDALDVAPRVIRPDYAAERSMLPKMDWLGDE